ncbi:MAG: hypothetical protein WBE28_05840 [bacterium]
MKKFLAFILFSGLLLSVHGQAPEFEPGQFVYDGAFAIDVGYFGSPFMYDWNGDGEKDLITGQFTNGNIRYYENIGENNDPVFSGFSYLLAGGSFIVLPYG